MDRRLLHLPLMLCSLECSPSDDTPDSNDRGDEGSTTFASDAGAGPGETLGTTSSAGGPSAPFDGIVLTGEPLTDLVAISAGGSHTCAIRNGGQVMCWGDNEYGQLGDGSTTNSLVAVPVSGITDAVAIGLAIEFSCALLESGEVACWGRNSFGQLGNGAGLAPTDLTRDSATPVMVSDLQDAVSLHVGPRGACVVREDGGVACWGLVVDAAGLAQSSGGRVPKIKAGVADARSVGLGESHACVLHESGGVSCWGARDLGQLGDGMMEDDLVLRLDPSDMLVPVIGIDDAVSIDGGDWNPGYPVRIQNGFTCAVRETGSVLCWGANDYLQLGDVTPSPASGTPVSVDKVDDAIAVSVGHYHACALSQTGTVACWGVGSSGQVGSRPGSNGLVVGLDDATAVSAGDLHSCALRADTTAVCWGANEGRLGDGTTTLRMTPTVVIAPD